MAEHLWHGHKKHRLSDSKLFLKWFHRNSLSLALRGHSEVNCTWQRVILSEERVFIFEIHKEHNVGQLQKVHKREKI